MATGNMNPFFGALRAALDSPNLKKVTEAEADEWAADLAARLGQTPPEQLVNFALMGREQAKTLPHLDAVSSLFSLGESRLRERFARRVVEPAARQLARPLSQTELEALWDYQAALAKAESGGKAGMALISAVFWLRGFKTHKFPFLGIRQPPQAFSRIFAPKSSLLVWQTVRYFAYYYSAKLVAWPLVHAGLEAQAIRDSGRATDPRLVRFDFESAWVIKRQFQELNKKMNRQQNAFRTRGNRPDSTRDVEPAPSPPPPLDGWQAADVQASSEAPEDTRTPTRPAWPRPAPVVQPPPASGDDGGSDPFGDGFFGDDDPSDSRDAAPRQPESAWDRIRRQAMRPQAPKRQQQQQQPPSSESQDWANAQHNPESDAEREKAQREFDAMLERERQVEQYGGRRRN